MALSYQQQPAVEPQVEPQAPSGVSEADPTLAYGNAAAAEALYGAAAPTGRDPESALPGGPSATGAGEDALGRLRDELAAPSPDGTAVLDALLNLRRGQLLSVRADPALWDQVVAICSEAQLALVEERVGIHDEAVEDDDNVWFALADLRRAMGECIVDAVRGLDHGSLSLGQTAFLPVPREQTREVVLTEETCAGIGMREGVPVPVVMRAPELAVLPILVTPTRAVVRVIAQPARTRVALAHPTPWRDVGWAMADVDVLPLIGVPRCPPVQWR